MRLDQYVAESLGVSRNRAQFFVDHGFVQVDGKITTKRSMNVVSDMLISIDQTNPQIRYVSRSAEKLATFLDFSGIDVSGSTCLDIGASTGGFTQILLERGAEKVFAVDIGTAQLHERLRSDERIISTENTDIREWTPPILFSRIVADVSFISLREILPHAMDIMNSNGVCIVLFKPQFEVGRVGISKSGVPKTEKIRLAALEEFRKWSLASGYKILCEHESTLPGEA